jgi:hypothetical protein
MTALEIVAALGLSVAVWLVARSPLGLLNFLVLQWFGVRLARSFRLVHDIPDGEFPAALESVLYNVMAKCYAVDVIGPPPKSYPLRRVPNGWCLQRWIWPLTGWWSPYRWLWRR